jgi:[protein-PII] uridylyltransferase
MKAYHAVRETFDLLTQLKEVRQTFHKMCQNDVPGLLAARTHADTFIRLLSEAIDQEPVPKQNWALVALGGFGRGNLSFLSDLDLLVLHQGRFSQALQEVIQKLFYGLWDADFEVGHVTASVSAVKKLVQEDFSVLTTHLESRFIAGDQAFFDNWRRGFLKSFGKRQRRKFFQDLLLNRQERLSRYGETSYLLEPHLKEGVGGLRDLHTIRWVGNVYLNDPSWRTMTREGWLTLEEKHWMEQAHDFLWRVRLQLHQLTNRRQDQLYFPEQEKLADRLGFLDSDQVSAVEAFMRHYYRHTARIRRTTSFILDHLQQIHGNRFKRPRRKRILPGPLLLEGQNIQFLQPELIPENPRLLMRIFWQCVRSNAHFHHQTGRIIRENLRTFGHAAREDPEVIEQFFDILLHPVQDFPVLEAMLETGFLQVFLPEFAAVRYRVQHDVYHLYTVDEHLLRTERELHFMEEEPDESLEKIGLRDIFVQIKNRRILYLAALLHDIGKGQGKNHSIRGVEMVRTIAGRLKLNPRQTDLLCFLVGHHLLLPDTALKRDLTDEKPLVQCAMQVSDHERLRLLYLLTIADSRATGPGVWNAWRASLLRGFYIKVDQILFRGDWKGEDVEKRSQELRKEVLALVGNTYDKRKLTRWLNALSSRYLLSQEPDAVVRHYAMEQKLESRSLTFDARPFEEEMWEITVATRDFRGLFALITGVLWAHGLNILSADIFTRKSGIALDVLIVERLIDPFRPHELLGSIENNLAKSIEDRSHLDRLLASKHKPSLLQPKAVPRKEDRVIINEEASDLFTVIEVYTWDRPGVLYIICNTFYKLGISIQLAKISTPGAQVADVFYVTDQEGNKLLNEQVHENIKRHLLECLNEFENGNSLCSA